jgi:hypothetical protein
MRWAGNVARMGEVFTGFLVGMPEGKRPLRRTRHWWEDYIKTYPREKGINGAN